MTLFPLSVLLFILPLPSSEGSYGASLAPKQGPSSSYTSSPPTSPLQQPGKLTGTGSPPPLCARAGAAAFPSSLPSTLYCPPAAVYRPWGQPNPASPYQVIGVGGLGCLKTVRDCVRNGKGQYESVRHDTTFGEYIREYLQE